MNEDREDKIKEEIKILLEKGFFDIRSGQIIIDKNNGVIQNIKVITISYRRSRRLDKIPCNKVK
jgi:hypothetical protein